MNGSAGTCSLRGFQILIGSVDLDALKITARKAEFSLTENALSAFHAEPTHYRIQRNIFGICPHSGEILRLSDCKVFLRTQPKRDWKDELDHESDRLDRIEERLDEKEEQLRETARKKGRTQALHTIKRLDPVFTPRNLNPDDAKVLFHPVDYIVFDGMKAASMKNLAQPKSGSRSSKASRKLSAGATMSGSRSPLTTTEKYMRETDSACPCDAHLTRYFSIT
jgi:predicted Holliday junction resolvase-like endonuclease